MHMLSSPQQPIGGFFGLELPQYNNFPLPLSNGAATRTFNTGRNALSFILKLFSPIQRLYAPIFTCPAVKKLVHSLSIPVTYYSIDRNLELVSLPTLQNNEYILYTNYFGIKETYVNTLTVHYGTRLILDNALALFSPPPSKIACFYSPRKFCGVPDGGIAIVPGLTPASIQPPRAVSHTNAAFLLQTLEQDVIAASTACEQNEQYLACAPVQGMSLLTERLLQSIDFEHMRNVRLNNFLFLHTHLASWNRLNISLTSLSVPMCYPFCTPFQELRNILIENNILIPIYWEHLLHTESCHRTEHRLAKELLPLPLDQRYREQDLSKIVSLITQFYQ